MIVEEYEASVEGTGPGLYEGMAIAEQRLLDRLVAEGKVEKIEYEPEPALESNWRSMYFAEMAARRK
jgi:hypothetical protein